MNEIPNNMDYEEIEYPKCQYPVPCQATHYNGLECEEDCGEPAFYRVWWSNEEGEWDEEDEGWCLCEQHYELVKEQESQQHLYKEKKNNEKPE